LLESNAVVFGAGLVPAPASFGALFRNPAGSRSREASSPNLFRFDVRKGEAADRLRWLESRVHNLHPALRSVRITHRWAGPILFTEGMRPIFRRHPQGENAIVLAGYNGHGVALSVYLGQWAAEALLDRRPLPRWP
jgi:glycine/D-amino acid oxidase-like deaminating enzyme